MQVTGGCLCGHIAYEAIIDPARVAICHCADCQVNSGTAFGVVASVTENQFTLLRSQLKVYHKIAESGRKRALSFCPECGRRIHARTQDVPAAFFGLRVGTIDQRQQLIPKRQVWCQSALPWLGKLATIPAFQQQGG